MNLDISLPGWVLYLIVLAISAALGYGVYRLLKWIGSFAPQKCSVRCGSCGCKIIINVANYEFGEYICGRCIREADLELAHAEADEEEASAHYNEVDSMHKVNLLQELSQTANRELARWTEIYNEYIPEESAKFYLLKAAAESAYQAYEAARVEHDNEAK